MQRTNSFSNTIDQQEWNLFIDAHLSSNISRMWLVGHVLNEYLKLPVAYRYGISDI